MAVDVKMFLACHLVRIPFSTLKNSCRYKDLLSMLFSLRGPFSPSKNSYDLLAFYNSVSIFFLQELVYKDGG